MKILLGFVLGMIVATAGALWAQSNGTYTDGQGRMGTYFEMPGGATNYTTPDGRMGTIYQFHGQDFSGRNPC